VSFLTDVDIEYLTGYKQPAAQVRFLQRWKIRHVVSANGAAEGHMGCRKRI
jgi:hypothetical protein